jgi:hypothetical protein
MEKHLPTPTWHLIISLLQQIVELDVPGTFGVDGHRAQERFIDADSHGFSAAYQRYNRC